MPVQSMITKPSPHDILAAAKADSISVKGFAWGGGGQGVARVDVSLDGGNNFTRADLLEKPVQQRRRSEWSWQFFEKNIPIPEEVKEQLKEGKKVEITLTSNAFNSVWNVQPENVNYNAHGVCVNHWYKLPVTLDPTIEEDVKAEEGEFANKPSGGHFRTPFRNMDQPETLRQREEEQGNPTVLK